MTVSSRSGASLSGSWVPEWAMIFAAGMGSRMMPLTANCPKPMLHVNGEPLLSHALTRVQDAGISKVVINTHYCADAVHSFVRDRQEAEDGDNALNISISHEEERLETGGGVRKALDEGLLPGDSPLLLVNSDILLTDPAGQPSAIQRLGMGWKRLGNMVDVLLLVVPRADAWGHESPTGDYALEGEDGRLRRISNSPAPFVFSGIMIARPSLFYEGDYGAHFSNIKIMDAAQSRGRLFGVAHEGGWYHFSTPEALERFHDEVAA